MRYSASTNWILLTFTLSITSAYYVPIHSTAQGTTPHREITRDREKELFVKEQRTREYFEAIYGLEFRRADSLNKAVRLLQHATGLDSINVMEATQAARLMAESVNRYRMQYVDCQSELKTQREKAEKTQRKANRRGVGLLFTVGVIALLALI
jgi:hypothetical protein